MKQRLLKLWEFIYSLFASPKEALSVADGFPEPLKRKLLWLKDKVYRGALLGVPLANYIEQWKNAVVQYGDSVIGSFKIQVAQVQAEIKALQEKLNMDFQQWLKNTAAGLTGEFEAVKAGIYQKYGVIEESLKNARNELVDCRIGINDFVERHQFTPAQKGFWDSTKGFILILCGITCIEYPLVYLSLERLSLGASYQLGFYSILYSVVIAAICDLAGQAVARRNKLATTSYVGLSLGFIGALIYLRLMELPQIPETSVQTAGIGGIEHYEGVMNILSLVFLGLAMAVAVRLHRDRPYWELKAKETKLIPHIEALVAQQACRDRELEAAKDVFNARVYNEALKNEATAKEDLAIKELQLSELNAEIEREKILLQAYEKEGIAFLTTIYNNGKNRYN